MPHRKKSSSTPLDRRGFLIGAGVVGTAAVAMGPSRARAASLPQAEIHNHVVPPDYVKVSNGETTVRPGWLNWTPQSAVSSLERSGRNIALLAYSTPTWWFSDKEQGRKLARLCNDYAAQTARSQGASFGVLAGLPPLDDTEGALGEIARTLDNNARGVTVMTSYGDRWLDHKSFAPVWDELDRRGAMVYVQPSIPPMGPASPILPESYAALQLDTARAVASVKAGGRWSRISFVYSPSGAAASAAGVPVHSYWWERLPQHSIAQVATPGLSA